MVDPDILRSKSSTARHHIERLRSRLPLRASSIEKDEDLCNIVLMDLQQAVQAGLGDLEEFLDAMWRRAELDPSSRT